MVQRLELDPKHIPSRLLSHLALMLKEGSVVALPTDASFSLVWGIGHEDALIRVRRLRGVDERHLFTLFCRDLSVLGRFARVDNRQYRIMKRGIPGPFTFILEGSRDLPRRVLHPKRRTLGLRVPAHPLLQALLAELGEPLLATTAEADGELLTDADRVEERFGFALDALVDTGERCVQRTTVLDLTQDPFCVIRLGAGDPGELGLVASDD